MFSWSRQPGSSDNNTSSFPGSRRSSSNSNTISRSTHLASYLSHPILKPSTRKVSSDDTIYDTVFQTTNGFALILRVYLPAESHSSHSSQSPRAPTMTLHGVRASHNWLDIRMKVIGYDPISSDQTWRNSNLKLGDAVYHVIHHLQLNPPSILEITDSNLRRLQDSLSSNRAAQRPSVTASSLPPGSNAANLPFGKSFTQSSPSPGSQSLAYATAQPFSQSLPNDQNFDSYPSPPQHPPQPTNPANPIPSERELQEEVNLLIPPIPQSFPQLDSMTSEELQQLIDDDGTTATATTTTDGPAGTLHRFLSNIDQVTTLKELKQSIETSNELAAKSNLEQEDKLTSLQTELTSLQTTLKDSLAKYKELDAKRSTMTKPPELREVIDELNVAKKKAFRESEELAEDWLEEGENAQNAGNAGGVDGANVNEFVKRFMDVRLLYHTRGAKVERLGMSM